MQVIEIKKDQQEYIPQIALLESEIFPDPWSEKSIQETLENSQARIWAVISRPTSEQTDCPTAIDVTGHSTEPVTTPSAQLLGYVIFYYVLDEGEIARIATSSAHRRQGLAARLLGKMRTFSQEENITRWLLDVRKSNEPAIQFYEAAGFARDGVRKNFYANPVEDAILMSCEV